MDEAGIIGAKIIRKNNFLNRQGKSHRREDHLNERERERERSLSAEEICEKIPEPRNIHFEVFELRFAWYAQRIKIRERHLHTDKARINRRNIIHTFCVPSIKLLLFTLPSSLMAWAFRRDRISILFKTKLHGGVNQELQENETRTCRVFISIAGFLASPLDPFTRFCETEEEKREKKRKKKEECQTTEFSHLRCRQRVNERSGGRLFQPAGSCLSVSLFPVTRRSPLPPLAASKREGCFQLETRLTS